MQRHQATTMGPGPHSGQDCTTGPGPWASWGPLSFPAPCSVPRAVLTESEEAPLWPPRASYPHMSFSWHPSPAPYVFNCYLSRPIKGTAWLTLLSQSPGQVKVLPHTYSQRNERSQLIVIIIQAPLPELGFGHTPVRLAKRPTARWVVIFSWPGWPGHGGKSLSTLCCSSPRRGTSWTEPRRG